MSAVYVVYVYSASGYTLRQASLASLNDTHYIITEGFAGDLSLDADLVDGVGIQAGSTYEQAFGLQVISRVLGLSASLYETQDATDVKPDLETIGSQLDLIPFLIILVGMGAYGYFVYSTFVPNLTITRTGARS